MSNVSETRDARGFPIGSVGSFLSVGSVGSLIAAFTATRITKRFGIGPTTIFVTFLNLPAMLFGLPFEALAVLIALRGAWSILIHSNVALPSSANRFQKKTPISAIGRISR